MANHWWAVPEGTLGQLLSGLGSIVTGHGTTVDLYHAVSSSARPAGNKQNPVYGPYATQGQAQAQANELNGIAGAASRAGAAADPGAPPGANSQGPGNPLAAIADFFSRLGQANTWIRAAEVILGLGLLIVGLAKLASGTSVGRKAAKAAETAALV
jgi:hypothetical protein